MSPIKKICRQYSIDYLSYGFIASPQSSQLPMCLMCNQTLSNEAMKPSRLKYHLYSKHADQKEKPLSYFLQLKTSFEKRKTLISEFQKATTQQDNGMIASYNIALLVAKASKSHTIGETLLQPVIEEVLLTVMHKNPDTILKTIPLSNNTISRRIDEMATDVKHQLIHNLRSSEFSIQVDESTVVGSQCLMMVYVRFLNENIQPCEEMLFTDQLLLDSKGTSILDLLKLFFNEHNIPLNNIVACASDGAPAMVGRYRGFSSLLKLELSHPVLTVHCVAHRQHLVAKHINGRLSDVLQLVIKTVNKLKSNSLSERIFRQLCLDNDDDYVRLLYHTEVRWLSKGNCVVRFVELFDTIIEFFQNTLLSTSLIASKCDIFFLSDIFAKLNDLNTLLQGKQKTLVDCKSSITAFISKLTLYKMNISRRQLHQFQRLNSLKDELVDEDVITYREYLQSLHDDMVQRFQDIIALPVPVWYNNPFDVQVIDCDFDVQEELVDLQNDNDATMRYRLHGKHGLWYHQSIVTYYPNLWKHLKLILLAFPTSYLVEAGFSHVNTLLSKSRSSEVTCG